MFLGRGDARGRAEAESGAEGLRLGAGVPGEGSWRLGRWFEVGPWDLAWVLVDSGASLS